MIGGLTEHLTCDSALGPPRCEGVLPASADPEPEPELASSSPGRLLGLASEPPGNTSSTFSYYTFYLGEDDNTFLLVHYPSMTPHLWSWGRPRCRAGD